MAVIASAGITLAVAVDVAKVETWYKLQASTSAAPSKPTTANPSDWTTTEPGYDGTTTNTLYTCQCTTLTDGTFYWGSVCVSSSYEAAKQAANAAAGAATAASNAQTTADEAQASAADAAENAMNAQAAADNAGAIVGAAVEAADDAQATANVALDSASGTAQHFWVDGGGAHVSFTENLAHVADAGYNMTLGVTDSTTGIILDHDDETLASFTPTALNFYAEGQVSAGYTRDGVTLYAQDGTNTPQQVATFTRSGVTFFDGTGNGKENITALFGSGGAVIGTQGGKQVVITSNELAFEDGGETVAAIDGAEIAISAASIRERLSIGKFAWIPRSNDNLALKWMG